MIKKTIILFFVFASVYFIYSIVENYSKIQDHRIKDMKYIHDNQQYMEKRIQEIELRRDALEKTIVQYMRNIDNRMNKSYKEDTNLVDGKSNRSNFNQ